MDVNQAIGHADGVDVAALIGAVRFCSLFEGRRVLSKRTARGQCKQEQQGGEVYDSHGTSGCRSTKRVPLGAGTGNKLCDGDHSQNYSMVRRDPDEWDLCPTHWLTPCR